MRTLILRHLSKKNLEVLKGTVGEDGYELALKIMPYFKNLSFTMSHEIGNKEAVQSIISGQAVLSLEELRRQNIKHKSGQTAVEEHEFLSMKICKDQNLGFVYCRPHLENTFSKIDKPTLYWQPDELPSGCWFNFYDSGIITRRDIDAYAGLDVGVVGFNKDDTYVSEDFYLAAALKAVKYLCDCAEAVDLRKNEWTYGKELSFLGVAETVIDCDATIRKDILEHEYRVGRVRKKTFPYRNTLAEYQLTESEIQQAIPLCQSMVIGDLAEIGQIAVPTRLPIKSATLVDQVWVDSKQQLKFTNFTAGDDVPHDTTALETALQNVHENLRGYEVPVIKEHIVLPGIAKTYTGGMKRY